MSNALAAPSPEDIYRQSVEWILGDGGAEWFFEHILKFDLDEWQLFGIEGILDVPRKSLGYPTKVNHKALSEVSAVSCHGTGKTQWLAALAHVWMYCFYGLTPVTAPKQDQLKTRFMPRFRKAMRHAEPGYRGLVDTFALTAQYAGDPDWGLVSETAADPENLHGYHETPQLFMVDEASSPRLEPMFPVIDGALSTQGSVLATIGNPTRSSGSFFNAHNKPSQKTTVFRILVTPPLEYLPADIVAEIESLKGTGVHHFESRRINHDWVLKYINKYGELSPVTRIRAFGLFTSAEKGQLIHYEWLSAARDRDLVEDGSVPSLIVSADCSDGGEDFTEFTVQRRYETVRHFLKKEQASYPGSKAQILIAKRAIELFNDYGGNKTGEHGDKIVIDGVGVGAGAAGRVMEAGYPCVVFKGGATSDDPDEWRNRRVQAAMAFRNDLRDGKAAYADDFVDDEDDWDEYCAQCTNVLTRPGDERREDLEPKEKTIARTHKSPDAFDSSIQCYESEVPDMADIMYFAEAVGQLETANANW